MEMWSHQRGTCGITFCTYIINAYLTPNQQFSSIRMKWMNMNRMPFRSIEIYSQSGSDERSMEQGPGTIWLVVESLVFDGF